MALFSPNALNIKIAFQSLPTSTKRKALAATLFLLVTLPTTTWCTYSYFQNQSIAPTSSNVTNVGSSLQADPFENPTESSLNNHTTIKNPKNLANEKRGNNVSLIKDPMVLREGFP
ncbi:hypothetical protein [Cardinium endosymbiont of Nabis limbatus]|uniref:hypothetical protein n=1 Tax=Cardinium endosymbiont of Nabis limbatus TaxID=3066217 RepID=UPI003AF3AA06